MEYPLERVNADWFLVVVSSALSMGFHLATPL
jgi:hypothetical protein